MAVAKESIKSRFWNSYFWACTVRSWVKCDDMHADSVLVWLFRVVGVGTASLGEKAWMGLNRKPKLVQK